MRIIRTEREAQRWAARLIPNPEWGSRFYHDYARFLLEGVLRSLVRNHGETTPRKVWDHCETLEGIRSVLQSDPDIWRKYRPVFGPRSETDLTNSLITLRTCLALNRDFRWDAMKYDPERPPKAKDTRQTRPDRSSPSDRRGHEEPRTRAAGE